VRTLKATIIACLAASISLGTGAVTSSARVPSSAASPSAAVTAPVTAAAPATPLLVGVRAASHRTFDRVVWEFRGGLPKNRSVQYVRELIADGSGQPVRIAGSAILELTVSSANAHDENTGQGTAPSRVVSGLGNVIEVVESGDFEATVSYGVGLAKRQKFSVTTLRNPSRIVVDVRKDYRQATRKVRLLDEPRFARGTPPFTRNVNRRVPAAAPAGAALHQLFAGPTAAEHARGLRTVRSGATGFTRLTVSKSKVARVYLKGGCSSSGSTFTVANLIRPTLKQFANVRWVKIYDPQGHTEHPTGRRDSIPECLEP
jgi:hypothetical protein